ncbi:zinc-ribbon domain-containing protein [Candidatus Electronema sp. TJ]|uniref:zinc-ribbon domain-containing protein n=1 Tax=Candidatus Electronema sp. TJ TaxID=3401573 RepID=UPI003AA938B6
MLVICEDCAKKYHIDESQIKGQRAKFACKACGHIIVVEKPKDAVNPPAAAAVKEETASVQPQPERRKTAEPLAAAAARGRGKPILLYLSAVMTAGLLAAGSSFLYLYSRQLPTLLAQEREQSGIALALSLERAVRTPFLQKDYAAVNLETEHTAKLPGVAYAAVMNEKGAAVAGYFNPQGGFDNSFVQQVKAKGFPAELLAQNRLKAGTKEDRSVSLSIGGLPVHDRVLALREGDGEVHVGLQAAEARQMAQHVLCSPLLLVPAGLTLLFAGLLLFIADWLVVRPARALTNIANRISLGELNLAITAEGSRELRDLGTALERMRHSVRIAVERLRVKRQ